MSRKRVLVPVLVGLGLLLVALLLGVATRAGLLSANPTEGATVGDIDTGYHSPVMPENLTASSGIVLDENLNVIPAATPEPGIPIYTVVLDYSCPACYINATKTRVDFEKNVKDKKIQAQIIPAPINSLGIEPHAYAKSHATIATIVSNVVAQKQPDKWWGLHNQLFQDFVVDGKTRPVWGVGDYRAALDKAGVDSEVATLALAATNDTQWVDWTRATAYRAVASGVKKTPDIHLEGKGLDAVKVSFDDPELVSKLLKQQ